LHLRVFAVWIAAILLVGLAASAASPATRPAAMASVAARHSAFYVGGHYAGAGGEAVMHGQMYAEVFEPRIRRHALPLVLISGSGQSGMDWLGTPDGRPGWADFFVSRGYVVYVIDPPGQGRSPWFAGVDSPRITFPPGVIEQLFTASQDFPKSWPQAHLHTQWPGGGHQGDPTFDAFYKSQVPYVGDQAMEEVLFRDAGAALLDKIGPAILVSHSRGGALGWALADERPQLVRAIVAVEPQGPPFQDPVSGRPKLKWGLTESPLAYDPPISDPADLHGEQDADLTAGATVKCWRQSAPARRLKNLSGIPVFMISGQASYHAPYDQCTANYLQQGGVDVTYVRLSDVGITGNGHMMMLEKNSADIAAIIEHWVSRIDPAATPVRTGKSGIRGHRRQ
jgi:pimeloyl-ACP methyl ester carboxylesterase